MKKDRPKGSYKYEERHRRRNHSHIDWWPGADLPTIRVPPQAVCAYGDPHFILRGVIIEGADLHGWQLPLVGSMWVEAKDGYPIRIWTLKALARRCWRTIMPGDEVECAGKAWVVHRRKSNPRVRVKDVYLVASEVTLLASAGGDDAQRDAYLLARQLDPTLGAGAADPGGERS